MVDALINYNKTQRHGKEYYMVKIDVKEYAKVVCKHKITTINKNEKPKEQFKRKQATEYILMALEVIRLASIHHGLKYFDKIEVEQSGKDIFVYLKVLSDTQKGDIEKQTYKTFKFNKSATT